jgi:hypothetical protein
VREEGTDVVSRSQPGLLVVGWLLAFAIAAVEPRAWSPHTKLTLLGAALEVAGIGLLASDLAAPTIAGAWSRGRRALAKLVVGIKRRFRPTHAVGVGIATSYEVAGSVTAGTSVAFTEGAIEELQRELVRLRNRVDQIEESYSKRIDAVREALEQAHSDLEHSIGAAIAESKGEFFVWRIAGFIIALSGSVVLALANLF